MSFREVDSRYDGVRIEEEVLEWWRTENVFQDCQRQTEGRPLYIWNEGPPTANGRPGIHHVLARTFKDMFPRYKTMRGFHCPRRAGWDTHGLPVEHEIEKELGIFDKTRIEREVGVEEFTRRCRESVMRYIGDWERMTERMGFWVDMGNAYYTLDNAYIESVWHLLKVIWDRGLLYRGYKVVPYDPRIGATLSSHEVSLGYQEVEDPSIYVRFPVVDEPVAGSAAGGNEGVPAEGRKVSFLVWTTTPWTLPSNLALAVHPEVDYAWVRDGDETLILAAARVEAVLGERAGAVERTVKGRELEGLRYVPPFDFLEAGPEAAGAAHRARLADFVTTEDGTGVVHAAPAYGADDLQLGLEHGLPVLHGVGLDGHFLPEVEPVAGRFFKDADPVLIDLLRQSGRLYRAETHVHNYPHGWRTGDPLIYYAKDAWYIRTTARRDRLVELNRTINWVPKHVRDGRFGNWLEHNVDWALSRERFWGTPLPVWTDGAGDFICIGSRAELEALCGRALGDVDLHRPAVDEIEFVHPENGRTYRRVPEVIDCWFDSGAMSYAQWHWPFENREGFEEGFPADYICEAVDQTRGWFYTLHAISTLVSDSVAFRNCICLGHIVDKDGKKMSKSVGNIVDPWDVFDRVGADPLRWYLSARIAPGAQKRVSIDLVREVAQTFINTWWNTYAFFVLYARLDEVDVTVDVPLDRRPEIDRWILALLQRTIETVTGCLDDYDAQGAGRAIESFVDQLSNWYVRRNRRRFWKAAAGEDKQSAYLTLHECLDATNRMMAPFMPFTAEAVHSNLVRIGASGGARERPRRGLAGGGRGEEGRRAHRGLRRRAGGRRPRAGRAQRLPRPGAPAPPPAPRAGARPGRGGCGGPPRSAHPRGAQHQAARARGRGRRSRGLPDPPEPAAARPALSIGSSPRSARPLRRRRIRRAARSRGRSRMARATGSRSAARPWTSRRRTSSSRAPPPRATPRPRKAVTSSGSTPASTRRSAARASPASSFAPCRRRASRRGSRSRTGSGSAWSARPRSRPPSRSTAST